MKNMISCGQTAENFSLIESSTNLMKIISEPNRIKILCILSCENICVCNLAEMVGLTQNLVSHHLKVMQEGGILDKERKGNQLFYFIKPHMKEKVTKLFEFINII